MNPILEQNRNALMAMKDLGFFPAYEEQRQVCDRDSHVKVRECIDGTKTISLQKDGYEWRLNSLNAPEQAAGIYAESYGQFPDFAFVCIFGLSDGRAVRKLLECSNETQTILIYEPDKEIFFAAMESFPLDDILSVSKRTCLVVKGISNADIGEFLSSLVTWQNKDLLMECVLPNYDILYEEEYHSYREKMQYAVKKQVIEKNTDYKLAGRICDNTMYNLSRLIQESSANRLREYFADIDLEGTPAIIVSAGPSLDYNIHVLKKAEGKAFIIGVDSALKALVREGIDFQLAICLDPRKSPDVFADERVYDYPYLLSSYALPMVAKKNKNRLFFEAGFGFLTFQELISQETGKKIGTVRTGGSVATSALSLAMDLGFHNIIFVGQDLAFTGGRGHVSGFEKSEQADRDHVAGRVHAEVEAYGGGTVITDIQMDSYRQWFEIVIEENREKIAFYNATEGGARIKGTTEIKLEEVIERLCVKERNFDAMLASVPNTFEKSEQRRLTVAFSQLVQRMDGIRKKLQRGISAYHELICYMGEGSNRDNRHYQQLLKQIEEVNRIDKEEACMDLIQMYAKKEAYDVTEDIYSAKELSVREIAERGIALLNGYIQGIDTCEISLKTILEPELKNFMDDMGADS